MANTLRPHQIQTVMRNPVTTGNRVIFRRGRDNPEESLLYAGYEMSVGRWAQLGQPDTITVTVEVGDTRHD